MSASSTSGGGSPRNGASRSSDRAERDPERAVDAFLVGRVRQRLERGDVLRRAGRADKLGAEPCPAPATTSSTGTPSTVTP